MTARLPLAEGAPYAERLPDGWELRLKVTPKASKNAVGDPVQDAEGRWWLAVKVTIPPEDGKANEAVIKLLANHFGVPRRTLSLLSGQQSRWKRVSLQLPSSS